MKILRWFAVCAVVLAQFVAFLPATASVKLPETRTQAQPATWLAGYGYGKTLTITGSADGVLTNYQMKVTVYKGSGSSSGTTVYLGGHCKDDFSDVRFTKSDNSSVLDYWIETYTSGTVATFWVKFDSIAASPSTTVFSIFYDNSGASSASNGTNTFVFFDDATSDMSANYTQRMMYNNKSATLTYDGVNHEYALAGRASADMSVFTVTSGAAYRMFAQTKVSGGSNRQLGLAARYQAGTGVYYLVEWQNSNQMNICKEPTPPSTTETNLVNSARAASTDTWYREELAIFSSNLTATFNGTTVTTTDASYTTGTWGIYGGFDTTTTTYFKLLVVANYTLNDPTFAWGTEGTDPGSPPTVTISAASSVTDTTATLNGNITSTGGENCTVTVYWGATDGGTTPGSWSNNSTPTSPAQPQGVAAFTKNLTGLTENTLYYFSASANNSAGTSWPAASGNFTTNHTPVTPTVTVSAASSVTATTARINGNVTDTGYENPTVTVYYGTSNGGTTPGSWASSSAPTSPAQPQGVAAFYLDVSSLLPSTLYYYSAKATNSAGTDWPASSGNFTTSADPTTGDKNILYKQGALQVDVSAANTLTVHGLNPGGTDNWTMTAAGVTSGNHTVRITADGVIASLLVDGTERDTHPLFTSNLNVFETTGVPGGAAISSGNRYTFYAAGRYWAFYVRTDGDIYYKTSLDNSTWASATQVTSDGSVSNNSFFGIWFDGTYGHYSRYIDATHLGYRRFTPNSNGTVTYSAAETSIVVGNMGFHGENSIAVDGSGYPYILQHTGDFVNVAKSSTNDGTFTMAGGYPVDFGQRCYGIAITNIPGTNQMFAAYAFGDAFNAQTIRGRFYNGSAWEGSDETIWTGLNATIGSIIAGTDGKIYLSFIQVSGTVSTYVKIRSAAGSWGSEQVISTGNTGSSITYDTVTGLIYVFYVASNNIYFKVLSNGLLGTATLLENDNVQFNEISSSAYTTSSQIGILAKDATTGGYEHTYLHFPWEWPDNSNQWVFMENNSMSYADNMTIDTIGIRKLTFIPDSIILSSTLPDSSGNNNNGTFHWGLNVGDFTVDTTPMEPEPGSGPGVNTGSNANLSKLGVDVIPGQGTDTTDQGQAPAQKVAVANVPGVSDLVHFWSDMWGFNTDNIGWMFLAIVLVLFVFWLLAWNLNHVGYAIVGCSVIIGFFSIPQIGVFPWGTLIFAVLGTVAGTLQEVKA